MVGIMSLIEADTDRVYGGFKVDFLSLALTILCGLCEQGRGMAIWCIFVRCIGPIDEV